MRANASHRADAAPCMRPCRAAMIRRVATARVDEPTTATARLSDEDAPPVRARPVPPSSGRLEAAVRCDRRARDRRHRPLGTGTRMGGAIDRPDTARRGAGGRCVWRRPPPFRHRVEDHFFGGRRHAGAPRAEGFFARRGAEPAWVHGRRARARHVRAEAEWMELPGATRGPVRSVQCLQPSLRADEASVGRAVPAR